MEMVIDFPGGAKVDAHFGPYTVSTDQPPTFGGEDSEPTPFDLFLLSIGTCAGIFILTFCRKRGVSTDDVRIVQRTQPNLVTGLVGKIDLEIQVPPSFPKEYYSALIRSAELCKVEKILEQPPQFEVVTKKVELI